jgi:hypothetical protein
VLSTNSSNVSDAQSSGTQTPFSTMSTRMMFPPEPFFNTQTSNHPVLEVMKVVSLFILGYFFLGFTLTFGLYKSKET